MSGKLARELGLTHEDIAEYGYIEPDLSSGYETRPEVMGPLIKVIWAKIEAEMAIKKIMGDES